MTEPSSEESVDAASPESVKPSDAAEEAAPARAASKPPDAFPDQGPIVPPNAAKRLLRWTYFGLWFVALPLALAGLFVWALTPAAGTEATGALASIQTFVREQPVPVGIIAFTFFEVLIWQMRDRLPFARYAYPPTREDLPPSARASFDRARVLVDEADGIRERHEEEIRRDLSAAERADVTDAIDALKAAMTAPKFDEQVLVTALVKADTEVEAKLGRWRKSEVREYLESILVAVAVAMALRAFVIEAFKIPSGSMIPTLMVGDHIFVNKFVYGPAVPWSDSRFWTSMPPNRGDVIVFAYPEQPTQDFIKRTIALPGDKLEARSGHPWINDWEVPHCTVGTFTYDDVDTPLGHHEGELDVEFLDEKAYLTFYDHTSVAGYQGPFIVKPGELYVMGDNRNNSHDSRMWWGGQGGGVPFPNIRGRALFVWLSVSDQGFDWSRFGAPVMGRPRLPPAMRSLQGALDQCMKDRPPLSKTHPPPPKTR